MFDDWRLVKGYPEFINFFVVALVSGLTLIVMYNWLSFPYAMLGFNLPTF